MIPRDDKNLLDYKTLQTLLWSIYLWHEYSKRFVEPVVQLARKCRRTAVTELAPRAAANYIQGGDADVSCTAWFRTTLLGVVIHMCRRHAALTQAQVRLHWTAWRSDLSSVNCRRSCFSCCWSKGVEWPAKRSYVGLVAAGVQEQAEDILVPPLLRNCLTLMTFPFPCHYLPSRTVVLAIAFSVQTTLKMSMMMMMMTQQGC